MSMDTTAIPERKPYLGRCKECDYALFATEEDLKPAADFGGVLPGGAYKVSGYGVFGRCDKRHRVFSLRRIKGTYSKDHKCDSRCLNAKGHDCTCSCGGANHGRGHVVSVIEASPHTVTDPMRPAPAEPPVNPTTPAKDLRRERVHMGVEGEKIYAAGTVVAKKDVNDATLYTIRVRDCEGLAEDTEAIIKWFAPSFANPDWDLGEDISFKAKVKRHEDEYGVSTLVTYVEEV